jgi:DNA primase
MTKEDFYIIRNSITMRQVAEHYGFHIDSKGFIRCPFHGNGSERTPSLQIYDGCRGFYCRACGQGGDVIKFVQLYEGLTAKESALMLSGLFNVPITESGQVDEATRLKAQQHEFERQQQLLRSKEIKSDLNRIGTLLQGYNRLLVSEEIDTDTYCFLRGEIPKLEFQWDELFAELRK